MSTKQGGWFAAFRSPEYFEMLANKRHHNAFLLLSLIAARARYSGSSSLNGLQVGQALVGDVKACGLTRKEYRVALNWLETGHFVATKRTNKGTIVTLLDNPIYEYEFKQNGQQNGQQRASKGPAEGQQGATNNKETKEQGKKSCSSDDELESILREQGINLDEPLSDDFLHPSSPSPKSDFETFWEAYPRKIGKRAALQKWKQLRPPLARCLAAIETQLQSDQWRNEGGKFIPHPATWLHQGRWDDETKIEMSPAPRRRSC